MTPAITIGNFDGVHLGHRALLAAARQAADRLGGDAVAMTFEPHPTRLLCPDKVVPRLSSALRKQELFAEADMDIALIESFDEEYAKLSADEFSRGILHELLGAKQVIVGHDFGYGARREGDVETLKREGERLGFSVDVIEPITIEGKRASSTAIREALIAGDLHAARTLLGRDYDVDGSVVRGAGRGKALGIPTANLDTQGVLLPRPGIYATVVQILGSEESYAAATSLGTNPTFVSGGALTLEAHLLDFDRDIYGQRLRVRFVERLRDEEQYSDIDSLLAQIAKDILATRAVLQTPEQNASVLKNAVPKDVKPT